MQQEMLLNSMSRVHRVVCVGIIRLNIAQARSIPSAHSHAACTTHYLPCCVLVGRCSGRAFLTLAGLASSTASATDSMAAWAACMYMCETGAT